MAPARPDALSSAAQTHARPGSRRRPKKAWRSRSAKTESQARPYQIRLAIVHLDGRPLGVGPKRHPKHRKSYLGCQVVGNAPRGRGHEEVKDVLLHRPEDPALAAVKLLLLERVPVLVAVDIHALGLCPEELFNVALRVLLPIMSSTDWMLFGLVSRVWRYRPMSLLNSDEYTVPRTS